MNHGEIRTAQTGESRLEIRTRAAPGTVTPPIGSGFVLMEDGVSFVLMEDGVSKILLE
jgi:hypothetical protein